MLLDDQAEGLAFLANPRNHAGATSVERLDTHTAAVFLAGDKAYKLKRAVRYDYLDYSTIALRQAACEAEVRLNRRTAPALYLGTMPLTRAADGGLELGGTGPIVDWLVVMQRFPQEALLDRLAECNRLTLEDAASLADAVAAFHGSAGVRPDCGGADAMHRVIDGNANAFTAAGRLLDQATVTRVTSSCRDLVAQHAKRLDERRAHGMVRQCHGDLHLRNIVMIDGVPTLFDAVEFSDEFACIDVMYDLAFLVMDLLARHLPAHANRVLNRYLARTSDFDGLPLVPLFLSCRAAIRGKTSLAAAALAADPARVSELRARAVRYLTLADRLVAPAPVRLVAIGGYSGSGKSTLARYLAPAIGRPPGAVVVSTDEIRRRKFSDLDRSVPRWAYAPGMRSGVYDDLRDRAALALAAGYSVVADGVFAEVTERGAIEHVAAEAGVPFCGLWLAADAAELEHRLAGRGPDMSDATADVLRRQMERPLKRLRWHIVNAGGAMEDTVHAAEEAMTDGRASRDHPLAALSHIVF